MPTSETVEVRSTRSLERLFEQQVVVCGENLNRMGPQSPTDPRDQFGIRIPHFWQLSPDDFADLLAYLSSQRSIPIGVKTMNLRGTQCLLQKSDASEDCFDICFGTEF